MRPFCKICGSRNCMDIDCAAYLEWERHPKVIERYKLIAQLDDYAVGSPKRKLLWDRIERLRKEGPAAPSISGNKRRTGT